MKKIITLGFVFTFSAMILAQNKPINLIFDVTSSNEKTHQTAIRHVNFMVQNEPDAKLDVIVYSGSLDMVLADKSSVAEEILKLSENENVTFKVCSSTMKRGNADASMILKGVTIVQNPLEQIFIRQQEGWGYIKETNN
jgi:hypothetical protein